MSGTGEREEDAQNSGIRKGSHKGKVTTRPHTEFALMEEQKERGQKCHTRISHELKATWNL